MCLRVLHMLTVYVSSSPCKHIYFNYDYYYFFFCYVVKQVKLEEDDHYAAVRAALSQLHVLCDKICTRSITLKSLSNIRNKEAQFKKLCDAVSSENQNMCMTFSQVKPHLDECFYLQSQFADYRNQISTLLEFCNDISYGTA